MGTGIWSMHFVGMLSLSLPIVLGYSVGPTIVSWGAAVASSAVVSYVASHQSLTPRALACGAVVMAAGLCAMHYIGMAAIDLAPDIVWNPVLVSASIVTALATSAAALLLFFRLRRVEASRMLRFHVAGALVMGAAISAMH